MSTDFNWYLSGGPAMTKYIKLSLREFAEAIRST